MLSVAQLASANLITNGGFELPVAGGQGFNYSTPTGWSGTGYNGYSLTGTDSTTAPEGNQFGLIEIFAGVTSSLSQAITFPTTGFYELSYVDADRTGIYGDLLYDIQFTQSGTTNIATGLDAASTLTFSPRSFTFFAEAGAGTITFFADGSSGQNRSVYFDTVSLEALPPPAPEPGSIILLGFGALGLNVVARRRQAMAKR